MNLIFVYNANSGVLNGLLDLAHKTFSPKTYPCSLCAITYSPLGMRKEWRAFVQSLGYTVKFLHRDELATQHNLSGVPLPAVFIQKDSQTKPTLWIDAQAMNGCKTLAELQTLVQTQIDRAIN